MSIRLIQDLHAGISRRDWSAVEMAANRLRDEIEETRRILAGTGIGSLPNDYPLPRLATDALSTPPAALIERKAEPVGYCSEYGLTTLASKAHHYCLSVSKKAENEFQAPIFSTPPAAPVKVTPDGWVKSEDVDKMVAALGAFRGAEWWMRTENPNPDSHCLAPLVLQNMKLGYENGTLEPTMSQFKNLLTTAMFYQQKCQIAAAPAAAVKAEGWQDAIDRIVPALEPVSEDYPAEWALWQDRKRIRGELAALANKPACQTCNGRGEIGGTYGQTAESFGYFSEPCPDCSASPSPVTVGNPPHIEYAAKIVFEAMRLAAKEAGFDAPAWVERGNSNMQEEARRTAFRILSAAPVVEAVNNPRTERETVETCFLNDPNNDPKNENIGAIERKAEPVAWLHEDFDKELYCYDQATAYPNDRSGGGFKYIPVYSTPVTADSRDQLIEALKAERLKFIMHGRILLANLDWICEVTGEAPEDEDAHLVEIARAEIEAAPAALSASPEPVTVALSADEVKLLIPLLKAKISEDQSKHFNGKLWGHEIVNMSAMQRLVARLSASPSPAGDRDALIERLCQSPIIEALTPTNSNWEACEVVQDRYDLMKRLIRAAISLPEHAEDRKGNE